MANELKLPYVRFVRQVQSTSKAIVQWKSTMSETLEALKIAPWKQSTILPSDVSMPVNAPLTFTPSDAFDAFKMSSTVAGSGKQICHMGMAAYRYTIPADAITDSTHPTAVTLSLGADKFNTSGLRVAIYLSNTATPPTDWTVCREGTEFIPDETIDTVTLGVLASRSSTVSAAVNAAGSYTVTFDPAITANNAYLYVIISNYDYADFRTSREYYIEGSGVLDGANVQVSFEAAVTADGAVSPFTGFPFLSNEILVGYGTTGAALITNLYSLFPGAQTAVLTTVTGVVNPKVGVTISGADVESTGSIVMAPVKIANRVYTGVYIDNLAINLTSKDMSIIANVWISPPIKSSAGLYLRASGFPTTNTAEAFTDFAYGAGTVAIKAAAAGVATYDLTLTNVGQFVFKSGTNYTETTKIPVSIPDTFIGSCQMFIFFSVVEMGAPTATTTITLPIDPLIYLV